MNYGEYLPTMSSRRKNAESITNRIAMRVDLEANFSRSPRGFGDMPRSIQQESIEVAVQDAMLSRLLAERDGCRCTDSGFRIASRNSVEKWCLGNAGGVMLVCGPCTWRIFRCTVHSLAFIITSCSIMLSSFQVFFSSASCMIKTSRGN